MENNFFPVNVIILFISSSSSIFRRSTRSWRSRRRRSSIGAALRRPRPTWIPALSFQWRVRPMLKFRRLTASSRSRPQRRPSTRFTRTKVCKPKMFLKCRVVQCKVSRAKLLNFWPTLYWANLHVNQRYASSIVCGTNRRLVCKWIRAMKRSVEFKRRGQTKYQTFFFLPKRPLKGSDRGFH